MPYPDYPPTRSSVIDRPTSNGREVIDCNVCEALTFLSSAHAKSLLIQVGRKNWEIVSFGFKIKMEIEKR